MKHRAKHSQHSMEYTIALCELQLVKCNNVNYTIQKVHTKLHINVFNTPYIVQSTGEGHARFKGKSARWQSFFSIYYRMN